MPDLRAGGGVVSFEAKYNGICGSCTERIREGDQVRYVEDDLVHVVCELVVSEVDRDAKREVCQNCWLLKPCDCEVA